MLAEQASLERGDLTEGEAPCDRPIVSFGDWQRNALRTSSYARALGIIPPRCRAPPQLQVQSAEADNCIQLSLIGIPGERFGLRLTQKKISFTESFQL